MAKLLFCDDDERVRKVIAIGLRASRHCVTIVPDVPSALAEISACQPDVVFTDLAMPGQSGVELLRAIRSRPHIASIPVIVVSASAQRFQVEDIMRQGATDFLSKPFTIQDLRAKVEQYAGA